MKQITFQEVLENGFVYDASGIEFPHNFKWYKHDRVDVYYPGEEHRTFEVTGYETKEDFECCNPTKITGTGWWKGEALKRAKKEITTGNWYAVKFQSDDREEIEILLK